MSVRDTISHDEGLTPNGVHKSDKMISTNSFSNYHCVNETDDVTIL